MQIHGNHKTIELGGKTNSSDVEVIMNKIRSEQQELEEMKQLLKENRGKLSKHKDASLAALEKGKNAVITHFDSMKRQVEGNFAQEGQKFDGVEAKISECSELGKEALEKIRSESNFVSVSVSGLKRFEIFTKYAAEVRQREPTWFGMALPSNVSSSVLSSIGSLRKVRVGESMSKKTWLAQTIVPRRSNPYYGARHENNLCYFCGREKQKSAHACQYCFV